MTSQGSTVSRHGVYGLRFVALPAAALVPAPPDWPDWEMGWAPTVRGSRTVQRFTSEEALVNVEPDGQAHLDKRTRRTTLHIESAPIPDAMVHPHLASTAVVTARWFGRQSFHAGAFVLDGGVWAILGERQQGKSSALAWLHRAGHPIFTDDVLVVDGGRAFAGPRCLDLRAGAAEHFGMGSCIGRVGSRLRWRVRLPCVAAELPLRGWIVPEWSKQISVRLMPLTDRLAILVANRGLQLPEDDPIPWLPLLAHPMISFGRPREWSATDAAMGELLAELRQLVD